MAFEGFALSAKKRKGRKGKSMDFLKSILGDDLYSQVESKINAYNSDEANKDNADYVLRYVIGF